MYSPTSLVHVVWCGGDQRYFLWPSSVSIAGSGLNLQSFDLIEQTPLCDRLEEKRLQLTRIGRHSLDDLIADLVILVVTSLHLGASTEGADKL
jgi:hypothetical protein